MTKLEEKLIELGYESDLIWSSYGRKCYRKECNFHTLVIYLTKKTGKISIPRVLSNIFYEEQHQIDNLQLAFNVLQNDLDVLNKCG